MSKYSTSAEDHNSSGRLRKTLIVIGIVAVCGVIVLVSWHSFVSVFESIEYYEQRDALRQN